MSEEWGEALEVVPDAAEAVMHAAEGDWDAAADSSLSMSEAAIDVATGGVYGLITDGVDMALEAFDLPDHHTLMNEGAQGVGEIIGDAMFDLVGAEESLAAVHAFDDGDILGGLGHMAAGAGETITDGLESAGEAVVDGAESLAGDAVDFVEGIFD